jgi:hypothetical protein
MTDFVEPRDREAAAGGSLGLAAIGQQLANSPRAQTAAVQPSAAAPTASVAPGVVDAALVASGVTVAADANEAVVAKAPAAPLAAESVGESGSQLVATDAKLSPTSAAQPAVEAAATPTKTASTTTPTATTTAAPNTIATTRTARKTTSSPKGGRSRQPKAASERPVEIPEPVTEASVQKAANLAVARRTALVERLEKFAFLAQAYLDGGDCTSTMLVNQAETVIRDIEAHAQAEEFAAARKKAFADRSLSETFSTVMSSLGIDAVAVHESARDGNRPLADILIEVMLEARAKQQHTAGDR